MQDTATDLTSWLSSFTSSLCGVSTARAVRAVSVESACEASDSCSFALINITASCFFGIDEIKTAFLMYALASFHLDCALAECLSYAILNVSATLFRQSDCEISIVYGLAAKAAIHDAL